MHMSDLAIEFGIANDDLQPIIKKYENIEVTQINIDNKILADKYARQCGVYLSVNADKAEDKTIARAVYACLNKLLKRIKGNILIVGLGNPRYVADVFGTRTLDVISADNGLKKLYPLVSGETGVESCDIIKAVVDKLNPSAVIAIDTLATTDRNRLGKVYQLTDTGIDPGSGAGSARGVIDKEYLGVPFYAIGVPLVLKIDGELYTSAFIDAIIDKTSKIVGNAIAKWAVGR